MNGFLISFDFVTLVLVFILFYFSLTFCFSLFAFYLFAWSKRRIWSTKFKNPIAANFSMSVVTLVSCIGYVMGALCYVSFFSLAIGLLMHWQLTVINFIKGAPWFILVGDEVRFSHLVIT